MKNKLIKGLFGLGLGLSVFAITTGVNALTTENITSIEDGSNSAKASVTVGNVDVPVYGVEIEWNSLEFNWSYDEKNDKFVWNSYKCESLADFSMVTEERFEAYRDNIYTDSTCGRLISNDTTYEQVDSSRENYYFQYDYNYAQNRPQLTITDVSNNGRITPSIEWNSSEGYEWTIGNLYSTRHACWLIDTEEKLDALINEGKTIYTDEYCTLTIDNGMNNEIIFGEKNYYDSSLNHPEGGDVSQNYEHNGKINDAFRNELGEYVIYLKLEVDNTKEIVTPKTGDTIGTITVTIN